MIKWIDFFECHFSMCHFSNVIVCCVLHCCPKYCSAENPKVFSDRKGVVWLSDAQQMSL